MQCPNCWEKGYKKCRVKEITRKDKKNGKRYFLTQCIRCEHTFTIKEIKPGAKFPFDDA